MVTSPRAIEEYLSKRPYVLPSFKGRSRAALEEAIKTRTGIAPKFKTEPRPHQLEGLAFALHLDRALLFYGMRLGKTKITFDWATHLRRTGAWRGPGLIIAHAPVGLDVWVNEAAKHSELTIRKVHLDPNDLFNALDEQPDFIVMTWSGIQEMFCSMREVKRGKRKGESKLYPDLEIIRLIAECFDLVVIDEVHLISNWTSLRYKLGLALVANCTYRLGLTGTPFGRDPYALWAQFRLIEDGNIFTKNFLFFVEAFGKKQRNQFAAKGFSFVVDPAKLPVLTAKVEAAAMSYAREEVTTDKVQKGIVELSMYGDQRRAYEDAIRRLMELPDKQLKALQNPFHRLRQISAGYLPYTDDDGEEHVVTFPRGGAKMEWLASFLDEMEPGLKVLVFHNYIRSGQMICDLLTNRKIGHVWMRGDGKDKTGTVAAFQKGAAQFMVANVVSGGISVDLNAADYLLYYEAPVSPIHRAQSEARPLAERNGRLLSQDDLVCSPMDRRVLSFLAEGKDLLSQVVTKNVLSTLRM